MNDNSYNNQNHQDDTSNRPDYEVYSREYRPNGNQYNEYSYSYQSSENNQARPQKQKSGLGKAIAVIAAALVLALAIGVFGLFLAARMIFGTFEGYEGTQEDTKQPQETEVDTNFFGETQPPKETQKIPSDQEIFFGSEDDTKIQISDSTGVMTKGVVGDENLTIADVCALVSDSVVEITTSETSWSGIVYSSGAGSGVIINENGIILTNNHVIQGATYITVRLTNGKKYDAMLVATDAASDIAIIKIQPDEKLTVATFGNSDKLIVGEEVIAIGNPLGVLGGTVTNGIISALEREVTIDNEKMVLLQHSAAVSPGNSGGALFNMKGELVGIVNSKSSSSAAEGIGFAIPASTVLKVYNDLVNYGYVKGRPDSGLTFELLARREGYFFYQYYVAIANSRYTDELKSNDIIVSIDGKQPGSVEEAEAILSNYEIGDKVTIVVSRGDGNHTVTLTIREYTPAQ